jgi:hypothetical protein
MNLACIIVWLVGPEIAISETTPTINAAFITPRWARGYLLNTNSNMLDSNTEFNGTASA